MSLFFTLLALAGCPKDDPPEDPAPARGGVVATRDVTSIGAEDAVVVRSFVDGGQVPEPGMVDAGSFFAGRMPAPAACATDLCPRAEIAVGTRLDGSVWTTARVSLATGIDPDALPRPPQHVVLVLEHGNRTDFVWPSIGEAVRALVAQLAADDLVSVVAFGADAVVCASAVPAGALDFDATVAAMETIRRSDAVGLHEALSVASREIDRVADRDARIVVLTSGGNQTGPDPVPLGAALVTESVGIGVVGTGDFYRARIPGGLAELGGGAHAYAIDGLALVAAFEAEGRATVHSLATDVTLRVSAGEGWRLGPIAGAAPLSAGDAEAVWERPALFATGGHGGAGFAGGERGLAGGVFLTLDADEYADPTALDVVATWTTATGEPREAEVLVATPLEPGQVPGVALFTDEERASAFVAFDAWLGLRDVTSAAADGDCHFARGLSDEMARILGGWASAHDDPAAQTDADLFSRLSSNLGGRCPGVPTLPLGFSGGRL